LKSERDSVIRAPRPAAEIMTALDTWMDQAATGAVDGLRLGALLRRDHPVELTLPFRLDAETRAVDGAAATKAVLGLLIATSRPAIRHVIQGQIEDLTKARPGMSDAELAARLAELDREIVDAELAEESAIRSLEVAGVTVLRRPDADPRAVLAADGALPAA
jgi:hypothetical protein